jgi:hypothetical protein
MCSISDMASASEAEAKGDGIVSTPGLLSSCLIMPNILAGPHQKHLHHHDSSLFQRYNALLMI